MNQTSGEITGASIWSEDPILSRIFANSIKSDAELEREALEALTRQSILNYNNENRVIEADRAIGSRHGVSALLAKDVKTHSKRLIDDLCKPYLPDGDVCKYSDLKDLPKALLYLHQSEIFDIEEKIIQHTESRLSSDGKISRFLDYSNAQIRALAKELAADWADSAQEKVEESEKLLGFPIKGDSFESRYARTCDPQFWRRKLNVCIARAKEHFFLRLSLICKRREEYVSNHSIDIRDAQLKRQREWMRSTVLVPVCGNNVAYGNEIPQDGISLEDLAVGPAERFAKLYTFIHAMDQLGVEANLASAMITITLEPEWHPNPSHGIYQWNGCSPREAHQSLSKRWQGVLRDLHRLGIRLSGFRVVEPHKDACPHFHIWTLYRFEDELKIFSAIMKYFPNKLKVRMPCLKGEGNSHFDKIFDTRIALLSGKSRKPTKEKEGAQVEVSRIDRSISTGASYALKYVLKSVNICESGYKDESSNSSLNNLDLSKTTQQVRNAKRVEAYRSIWGINQGQLFGISKCLTIWDELRRVTKRPKNLMLRKLWCFARGSNKDGRIAAGSGQRGDARAFLVTLGGLDAAKRGKAATEKRYILGRLVETALNRYGDKIKKTVGVVLLSKQRVRVRVCRVNVKQKKEKIYLALRTESALIASIKTRTMAWKFVKKDFFKNIKVALIKKEAPTDNSQDLSMRI